MARMIPQDTLQQAAYNNIKSLCKQGFDKQDIVILSCKGQKSHSLQAINQIGKYRLKVFSGKYDHNNEQIYHNGEILFETVYRYKGEQSPAVMLIDLPRKADFQIHQNRRLLFCAMSRATVKLDIVA